MPGKMPRWREHEKRARKTALLDGYKVTAQKSSRSTGLRPDYYGVSKKDPSRRIVVDAKYVNELSTGNVDQVRRYKGHPFYAQSGGIVVKKSTKVSDEVREYARGSNISVVRMRARKEKKKRGFWDSLFGN
jgi:hypothetical protein